MVDQEVSDDRKWYNKTWVCLLLLLFVFPVGLYALWVNERLSRRTKQVIVGGWLTLLVTGWFNKTSEDEQSSPSDTVTQSTRPSNSSQSQTSTDNSSQSSKWYQGGTLHDKSVEQWKAASYDNRLATSADFAITLGEYEAIPQDLKEQARVFESCISEAVKGEVVNDKPVSEVGATCGVLLGY